MFASLLIANRGEIARRVMRTARRMGIATVAVYSDADSGAAHVRDADVAVRLGPAPAAESYLVAERIIAAAKETGAEAIHPGYGFLSENAGFAEAVIAAGLIWVGPPPAAILAMGLKDAAKRLMAESDVPVTPGYLGDDQSEAVLAREAAKIGWPVMVKAVAGGGGRGMRRVEAKGEFAAALASARREAASAFGDDRVLLEKAIDKPRHIEVQVFGDTIGNVVHLFERDCSLQRRHQKVIEEAPAPGMTADVRAAVCKAAVRAARAVAYEGAGTVEFIADAADGLRADRIWFMEMNTRLQVEHPVTEAITGVDLVEWQLRVAAGEALPLKQGEITFAGHAIEARLYAENPLADFLPSAGPLTWFELPASVRVDSGFEEGDEVTPYYDSMVAKLIAHGTDRASALSALSAACAETQVWPVKTNAGFLRRLLDSPGVREGAVETDLIAELGPIASTPPPPSSDVLASAAQAALTDGTPASVAEPWSALAGFRLNARARNFVRLRLEGVEYEIDADAAAAAPFNATGALCSPGQYVVFADGDAYHFTASRSQWGKVAEAADGAVLSPMPGRIVAVGAKAGDTVAKGAPLVTLEAMKMEHVLIAPFEGVVTEVTAAIGQQVSEGVLLTRVEAMPSPD
jgi:acetyl/propionyl-CoA carboxylase alpha subunit